jgi:hypothetical protein
MVLSAASKESKRHVRPGFHIILRYSNLLQLLENRMGRRLIAQRLQGSSRPGSM